MININKNSNAKINFKLLKENDNLQKQDGNDKYLLANQYKDKIKQMYAELWINRYDVHPDKDITLYISRDYITIQILNLFQILKTNI